MQEDSPKGTRIRQLPPLVANQIAAGEVVERPASVVKELVENAIDAGATKIEVQIEGGGVHLIRVRDNGCGIAKSDLALAFSRHATSKLLAIEDLLNVQSMGFRGEALASISSVSRCKMVSRTVEADNAWEISIGANLVPIYHIASHNVGTTIEVADLFYNTPVRRKFLKSEKTEFHAIVDVISSLALSYPQISFALEHQQKKICHYPAVSSLLSETARVGKICGQTFISGSFFVNMQAVGLSLKAWIGKPAIGRRISDCQYFFVNNRLVKDRLLNHVVRTLYQQHPEMVEGTCPSYVLLLTISPDEVDVNVHPTKQEVRFSQPRLVHDFITQCITKAVFEAMPVTIENELTNADSFQMKVTQCALYPFNNEQVIQKADNLFASQGKIERRYYVKEDQEGVLLVDLHLAKNDIMSAYFQNNWGSLLTKKLLFPLKIKRDKSATPEKLLQLEKLGFHFFHSEQNQLSLFQVPAIVKDPLESLLVFFNELFQHENDEQNLCEHLARHLTLLTLSQIPEDDLEVLITMLTSSHSFLPGFKLTHANIATKIEQYRITENLTI